MNHDAENWMRTFEDAGAVWRWSGRGSHAAYRLEPRHADFYLNTDVVCGTRASLERAVRNGLTPLARPLAPEVIVAPVSRIAASLILATELARELRADVGYFDLRDRILSAGRPRRALVCTDDVHGGGSARATILALREKGFAVVGLVTLANFSARREIEGVEIASLTSQRFGAWAADACPLCRNGSPAVDARARWDALVGANS